MLPGEFLLRLFVLNPRHVHGARPPDAVHQLGEGVNSIDHPRQLLAAVLVERPQRGAKRLVGGSLVCASPDAGARFFLAAGQLNDIGCPVASHLEGAHGCFVVGSERGIGGTFCGCQRWVHALHRQEGATVILGSFTGCCSFPVSSLKKIVAKFYSSPTEFYFSTVIDWVQLYRGLCRGQE